MKKIALLLTVVLFSTVFYSQEVLKISNNLNRAFKKRNVEKIDDFLLGIDFVKFSNRSLPDLIYNLPSMDYDLWVNSDTKEKIYIFKSNEGSRLSLLQLSYLYIHVKIEDIPFYCYQKKNYDLMVQEQDDYLVAMFVVKS